MKNTFKSPEEEIQNLEKLLSLEQTEDLAQYQSQILETPLKERQRNGSTWYPVRVKNTQIGIGGKFVIELSRNIEFNQPHQFSPGAQAVIFWNAPAGQKTPQLAGTILAVDQTEIKIQINEEDLPDWIDERLIGIDLLFDENSYREMKFALEKVKNPIPGSRLEKLRNVALGWEKPDFAEIESLDSKDWPIKHLNSSQQEAIKMVMASNDFCVIHGPPGTGKTTTLVAAIKTALTLSKQVLVCAPSNTAADLLTEKLALANVKVLRIGNPAKISEEIFTHTLDFLVSSHGDAKEIKRLRKLAYELKKMAYKYKKYFDRSERDQKQIMIKEAKSILRQITDMEKYVIEGAKENTQAFVSTLVGASNQFLKGKNFDIVFIDEAGQALEPACWIPILKAQKVVLAGDHCQLPPTVKSKDAARLGLDKTLLDKIIERQGNQMVRMLNIQYRMHETIMNFSSSYFYNNALQADASVKTKLLWGSEKGEENQPVVFIDTAGTGFEEKFNPGNAGLSNPQEAQLLFSHLKKWLVFINNIQENQNREFSISVISPYREQVEFLKKELTTISKNRTNPIKIGTVDGFQGQEAEVIYISLVRSNSGQEIGFLKDIRRMNVAITRAKKRLVVIGDSSTLSGSKFYKSFFDYIDSIGAYHSAWEFLES